MKWRHKKNKNIADLRIFDKGTFFGIWILRVITSPDLKGRKREKETERKNEGERKNERKKEDRERKKEERER